MKIKFKSIITIAVFLTTALAVSAIYIPDSATACGWGAGGGENYVPQRKVPSGLIAKIPTITEEKALDIVTQHVKRLNPSLKIGNIQDSGAFYEAEVMSEKNDLIQIIGVDKHSGRLVLIN